MDSKPQWEHKSLAKEEDIISNSLSTEDNSSKLAFADLQSPTYNKPSQIVSTDGPSITDKPDTTAIPQVPTTVLNLLQEI